MVSAMDSFSFFVKDIRVCVISHKTSILVLYQNSFEQSILFFIAHANADGKCYGGIFPSRGKIAGGFLGNSIITTVVAIILNGAANG
jgi:hypothetical protein